MSETVSLIALTTPRFNHMLTLASTFSVHPMQKDNGNGIALPLTFDEVVQSLRSEEGRMKSKKGAKLSTSARGGGYSLKLSLSKGDYSPLWRLYWLSGEILEAESEVAGLEKSGTKFLRAVNPVTGLPITAVVPVPAPAPASR